MGLFVIAVFLCVAAAGPILRPDSSPKANDQHLELARKSPGFSVQMLLLPNSQGSLSSFFHEFIYGFQPDFIEIPVANYSITGNEIEIEKFTGNDFNKGELLRFNSSDFESFIEAEIIIRKTYWLGTDRYGRDMLSRLMGGTWISFTVGFISILISLFIGISLGAIAAYYGGKVDDLIMWFINVIWSIPTLLLVIAMTLALGKGFWQVFVAVGLTMWVEVARVVRGQVMSVKQMQYVTAARALGFTDYRIITKHILPNIMAPVIIISAANFAGAILIESGLSFLGIGAQPPMPSWGGIIKDHYSYIVLGKPYLAIIPGLAIMSLVTAFMLVGNALRDALDVKN